MLKKWLILFSLLLCCFGQVGAQDDSLAREAAITAARPFTNARPSSWRFEILTATNLANLGCPTASATSDLGRLVVPYRYTLTYASGDYVVHASSDGTVVALCDPKFVTPPTAATPISATPISATPVGATPVGVPSATPFTPGTINPCIVNAGGAFVNVRERPASTGRQVGQIFSGQPYQASVKSSNPGDLWYYIVGGWVSATVVTTTGDCAGLSVNDGLIGTGSGLVSPAGTPIPANTALEVYACPSGFVGYLVPRIKTGTSTARVGVGGIPNTLRSQPVANDAVGQRLGTIQPSRTIDRVIQGPACSGSVVWWFVEIDGRQGWTAESNAAESEYYLEPTAGNEVTNTTSQVITSEAVLVNQREDAVSPQAIAFTPNNTLIVADSIALTDGSSRYVGVEYDLTGQPTDRGFAIPSSFIQIQFTRLADGREGWVAFDTDGIAHFYADDFSEVVTSSAFGDGNALPFIGVTSDGGFIAYATCEERGSRGECGFVNLNLIATQGTTPIWTTRLEDTATPYNIQFNADNNLIGIGSFEGITVIDRITGIKQAFLSNATETFSPLTFAFTENPDLLMSTICKDTLALRGCTKGELTLWNISTSTIVGVVETNNGNPIALLHDGVGQRVFIGDAEGVVAVRSAGTGELLQEIVLPPTETSIANSIRAMATRQDLLAVLTSSGKIYIYRLATLGG